MSVDVTVRANTSPMERDVFSAIDRINRSGKLKIRVDDKGVTQPLGNMKRSADEFTKSLEASNSRVIAFGASVMVINSVSDAFKGLVKATVEVEKHLANINVVMGLSGRGIEQFSSGLFKVARETAQSFNVASEAATEFARQGLTMEQTLKRTRDALILTRLTGMDAASSVTNLTAAMNTFGGQVKDSTELVSKFAAVDVKFAVSAEDFAQAISRAGASAKSAGVSLDEFIGMVTAAQQKTARGGAVIGNSLKTIFTRIQKPQTLQALQDVGIAVKDLEGKTLGAKKILTDLAVKFDTLTDSQRAYIAQQTAGIFQINILKAVLGDASNQHGIMAEATKISSDATNEAIEKNKLLGQTFAHAYTEAGLAVQELAKKIGELALAPGMSKVLDTIKGAADWLSGLVGEGEEGGNFFAKSFLRGFGNVLTGPGLVIFAAVIGKLFMNAFRFAKDSLKSVLGITTETQKQKNIQQSLLMVLSQNAAVQKEIMATGMTRTDQEKIILGIIKQQTLEAQKLSQLAASLAPALSRAGVGGNLGMGGRRGTRAHGHIPNYADEGAAAERREAAKGGYVAGTVKQGPGFLYNSRETIKKFPGLATAAIMPPSDSKAGANYRTSFIGQHGFDPYLAAGGHVPNFALSARGGLSIGKYQKEHGVTLSRRDAEALGYKDSQIGQHFGKAAVLSKTKGNPWAQFAKKFSRSDIGLLSKSYKVKPSTWLLHAQSGTAGPNVASLQNKKGMKGGTNLTKVNTTGGVTPITQSLANINKLNPPSPFSGPTLRYNASGSSAGNSTSLHDGISGGLNDALTKVYRKYLPKSLRHKKFKLADTGQEGQLNQTVGRIFENILTQAIGAKAASESERMDIPKEALKNNPEAKKYLEEIYGVEMNEAEIKHGQTPDSLGSYLGKLVSPSVRGISGGLDFVGLNKLSGKINLMGNTAKTIRQTAVRALGFIPNFAEGPLGNAISRERGAGIANSQIRVGAHPALANKGNPFGLGVTNTRDEPKGLRDVIPNFAANVLGPRVDGAGGPHGPGLKGAWGRGLEQAVGGAEGGKIDARLQDAAQALAKKYEELAKEVDEEKQTTSDLSDSKEKLQKDSDDSKKANKDLKNQVRREKRIREKANKDLKQHTARYGTTGAKSQQLAAEAAAAQRQLTSTRRKSRRATAVQTAATRELTAGTKALRAQENKLAAAEAKAERAHLRSSMATQRRNTSLGKGGLMARTSGAIGKFSLPLMMAAPMIGGLYEQQATGATASAKKALTNWDFDNAALEEKDLDTLKLGKAKSSMLTGASSGAMIGAGIGSILPGAGTLIGGAIGAMVGGMWGWTTGLEEGERAAKEHADALQKAKVAMLKSISGYVIQGEKSEDRFHTSQMTTDWATKKLDMSKVKLTKEGKAALDAARNPDGIIDWSKYKPPPNKDGTYDSNLKYVKNDREGQQHQFRVAGDVEKYKQGKTGTELVDMDQFFGFGRGETNASVFDKINAKALEIEKRQKEVRAFGTTNEVASMKGMDPADVKRYGDRVNVEAELTHRAKRMTLKELLKDNQKDMFNWGTDGEEITGKELLGKVGSMSDKDLDAVWGDATKAFKDQINALEDQRQGIIRNLKIERTKLRINEKMAKVITNIGYRYNDQLHAMNKENAIHKGFINARAKAQDKYTGAILKASQAFEEASVKANTTTKTSLLGMIEKDQDLKNMFTTAMTSPGVSGELMNAGLITVTERLDMLTKEGGEIELIKNMETERFQKLLKYLAEHKLQNKVLGEQIDTRLLQQEIEIQGAERAKNFAEDRALKEREVNLIIAERADMMERIKRSNEALSQSAQIKDLNKQISLLNKISELTLQNAQGGGGFSHQQKFEQEAKAAKIQFEAAKDAMQRQQVQKSSSLLQKDKDIFALAMGDKATEEEFRNAGSYEEQRKILLKAIEKINNPDKIMRAKRQDTKLQAKEAAVRATKESLLPYTTRDNPRFGTGFLAFADPNMAHPDHDDGDRIRRAKQWKSDRDSKVSMARSIPYGVKHADAKEWQGHMATSPGFEGLDWKDATNKEREKYIKWMREQAHTQYEDELVRSFNADMKTQGERLKTERETTVKGYIFSSDKDKQAKFSEQWLRKQKVKDDRTLEAYRQEGLAAIDAAMLQFENYSDDMYRVQGLDTGKSKLDSAGIARDSLNRQGKLDAGDIRRVQMRRALLAGEEQLKRTDKNNRPLDPTDSPIFAAEVKRQGRLELDDKVYESGRAPLWDVNDPFGEDYTQEKLDELKGPAKWTKLDESSALSLWREHGGTMDPADMVKEAARADSPLSDILSKQKSAIETYNGDAEAGFHIDEEQVELLRARTIALMEIAVENEKIRLAERERLSTVKEINENLSVEEAELKRANSHYDERHDRLNELILLHEKQLTFHDQELVKLEAEYKWKMKIAKAEHEYKTGPGAARRGFSDARGSMVREMEEFSYTLTNKIGTSFRDSMVSAIEAAITKADDLDSALKQIAVGFLQAIQKALWTHVANNVVSSILPGASLNSQGGILRSQGGGVPAKVSNGEYLMNTGAVQKYGVGFMNTLNNGKVPGYASGGYASGSEWARASQGTATGRNRSAAKHESEYSARYTRMPVSSYFLASNENVQLGEDRAKAKQALDKKRQEELEKKQERAALQRMALSTVLSVGLSYGLGKLGSAGAKAGDVEIPVGTGSADGVDLPAGKYEVGAHSYKGVSGAAKGFEISIPDMNKQLKAIDSLEHLGSGTHYTKSKISMARKIKNSWGRSAFGNPNYYGQSTNTGGIGAMREAALAQQSGSFDASGRPIIENPKFDANQYPGGAPSIIGHMGNLGRKIGGAFSKKKSTGGLISGTPGVDNIPAMLSEGEYVLQPDAVRQIGLPKLNAINAGKFARGGPTSNIDDIAGESKAGSGDSTNNVNITVNVENNGGSAKEGKSESDGKDAKQMQALGKMIEQKVVTVIQEESRPGGLLAKR